MEKKAKDKADKLAVLIEEYKKKTGIDKLEGRKDEEQITTLEQSSGPMGGINYTSKTTTVGEEKKRLAQNEIAVGDGSVGSNGNLASLELQQKAALEDEKKFKAVQADLAEKLKVKQNEVQQNKDSGKTRRAKEKVRAPAQQHEWWRRRVFRPNRARTHRRRFQHDASDAYRHQQASARSA